MTVTKPMIHKAIAITSLFLATFTTQCNALTPFDVNVHTGMGNSQGTLIWNIAGGTNGPDVLSELTYKDVKFVEYYGNADIQFNQGALKNYRIFMSYRSGVAIDGTVLDSDYDGDNRSQEYSRSESSAEDSTLRELNVGISHQYKLSQYQILRPAIAYINKQQNMAMTDGVQVVDTNNPLNVGSFRNALNSHYHAQWQGMWMGLEWGLQTPNHELSVSAKYYWLDYSAEANWNLRSDFAHPKSFEQWATGAGTGLSLFYGYTLSKTFSFWLNWTQESWSTDPGQDKVYFADGSVGGTQLNEVSWESSGISTGLVMKF